MYMCYRGSIYFSFMKFVYALSLYNHIQFMHAITQIHRGKLEILEGTLKSLGGGGEASPCPDVYAYPVLFICLLPCSVIIVLVYIELCVYVMPVGVILVAPIFTWEFSAEILSACVSIYCIHLFCILFSG